MYIENSITPLITNSLFFWEA